MSKPSESNFNLSKVKLVPDGGLKVEYQITEVSGGEPCVTDYAATYTREVHLDLKEKFKALRAVVGRVFGVTSFLSYLQGEKYPAMEEARAYADGLMDNYEIRGLALSGDGDGAGVVITAIFKTENGLKTCVNTPRIKTAQVSYGFEEELEQIVEDIKSEVYAYIFEGKQAQLSLFGQPGGDKPDDNDLE